MTQDFTVAKLAVFNNNTKVLVFAKGENILCLLATTFW